jgi:hypothetical protein
MNTTLLVLQMIHVCFAKFDDEVPFQLGHGLDWAYEDANGCSSYEVRQTGFEDA